LEGEINLLVGERNIRATVGSVIFVPKGTVHTFSQIGEQPAKFLVTYSPSGFEKFFDEVVDLGEMDTDGYITKANALADKYNMEVVGPPID
jgi:oxalate decarboxylase/phosphoglucose isomerase-like protein (cupin superfamily)